MQRIFGAREGQAPGISDLTLGNLLIRINPYNFNSPFPEFSPGKSLPAIILNGR
jgi:hypothetical protein